MMYLVINFSYLLLCVYPFITYDSGIYTTLNRYTWSEFNCVNGYSVTKTISFSGAFQIAPQVFVTLSYLDQQENNVDYQFEISTITTTNFNIFVQCTTNRQVYHVEFNWYAIDDKRVQVFNSFNMNTMVSKSFNYENPNTEIAIISLTSFYYGSGAIDFKLFVSEFTQTTVTVGITQDPSKVANLKQLGYQLILATNDAVVDLGLRTLTLAYTSPSINKVTNKWFILPLIGLNFLNTMMIVQKVVINTSPPTTLTYAWSTWSANPAQFVGVTFREVWLSYYFTTQYKALQCSFVRISSKFDPNQPNMPSVYLQIPTLNMVYSSIGDYSLIIDKSVSLVSMAVYMGCQNTKKILGQFNKCNDCPASQKKYYLPRYCNNSINQISFHLRFTPNPVSYQKLVISITDTSCSITQILYNQAITEQNILNVQLLNS